MKLTRERLTSEDEIRFWAKVDIQDGPARPGELGPCWPWIAGLGNAGYGVFQVGSQTTGTAVLETSHRIAFVLGGGILTDENPCALHRCDHRPCCNPAHLFAGTRADNTADMVSKGRHAFGERNGTRTHPEALRRGERNPQSKLTDAERDEVIRLGHMGMVQTRIAARFGISQPRVCRILKAAGQQRLELTERT